MQQKFPHIEMIHVLGLMDGGAVISRTIQGVVTTYEAIRVDSKGDTIAKLHSTTTEITGFILKDQEHILILENDGVMTEIRLSDASQVIEHRIRDIKGNPGRHSEVGDKFC